MKYVIFSSYAYACNSDRIMEDEVLKHIQNLEENNEVVLKKIEYFEENNEKLLQNIFQLEKKIDSIIEKNL